MKILSVIPSVNPKAGGPIQGIRNYQSELVKLGCTRDIVTFEDAKDVINWDFPATLKIHSLGKAVSPLSYNVGLFAFLKNNLANYDVVIIHGLWLYHSIGTIKAFKWLQKNKPYLKLPQVYCMPHGMLDPWFQNEKTRKIKAIRNYIYWHLIEKKVINSADGLLFTCEEELLLARTTFSGYRPKQELNIGYGIEAPPAFTEAMKNVFQKKCSLDPKDPYLLFLSRIHPKKGLDLLLKAYQQLLQNTEFASKVHNLIIAGPGMDTDYGKKLSQYLEEYPVVKTKVQFVGHLSGDAKWGAIYGCAAFVLPSHQENFGIAVAEALACYKPVLITNKVNIFREIGEGGCGIIDQDTLKGTLENLKKWIQLSQDSKAKMGENAHTVYIKHFDVKTSALRLINALNN